MSVITLLSVFFLLGIRDYALANSTIAADVQCSSFLIREMR